ncbi:protein TolQ [Bdellovibrionota bacterium FG-1]
MPNSHAAATGILEMIIQSSPVAKVVLLVLLIASIFCWAIIFSKWRALSTSLKQNENFLNVFWHGKNIEEIFAKSEKFPCSPVAAVFKNGVKELKKVTAAEATIQGNDRVDNVYRALLRSSTSEIAALENHLGWLGTTASAAPFIGLFGTVWGILESFRSIGVSGAANLAVVGPSISEALITTAVGIGAAIPAVVAYNYFTGQIRKLAVEMECFSHDFINIVQRSTPGSRKD